MRRVCSSADLLDEGLRFYRRHAPALLRFTLGPAVAMALIITGLVWVSVHLSSLPSGWAIVMVSLPICFPLLIFLLLGLLHAAAVDGPLSARQMATAALHRFGHRLVLALVALLPMQIIGIVVAQATIRVVEEFVSTIDLALRVEADLPWLFVQFCLDMLDVIRRLVVFSLGGLGLLLPCAVTLYLFQHRISRLPRLSVFRWHVLGTLLWQTIAGALLISALAFGALSCVSFLINTLVILQGMQFPALFGLILFWLWILSPPLPIWVALLYRHSRDLAQGSDLEWRVQVWRDAQQPLLTKV